MKDITTMRSQRADHIDAAKEIVGAAEAANRDLTAEEQDRVNSMMDEVDGLTANIEKAEKLASIVDRVGTAASQEPRRLTAADSLGSRFTADEDHAPVKVIGARYPGRLRSFQGERNGYSAHERAYRAGMWLLATAGNRPAQAFCKDQGLELVQAHVEGINEQGGYLVHEEHDMDIIDLRNNYGVFRNYARTSPMSSDTKRRYRRTGGLTAYAVGEGDAITESTKGWDRVTLVAREWGCMSIVSNELNEDAVINIADDLFSEMAYAFAQKEDECGFEGDGSNTYHGIKGVRWKLTQADYAGGVQDAASGNTSYSTLDISDFTNTIGLLPDYGDTPNTAWYCHRTFWAQAMARLQYEAGGNTNANIAGANGPTFMGYPVVWCNCLPSTSATSQVACMLGDLTLAADFGDRQGIALALSNDATVGSVNVFETNQMAARGTSRWDINVHDVGTTTAAGPIVGLKTASS